MKVRNIAHQFYNQANDDEHVLVISGAIGDGGWFFDATNCEDVRDALKDVKADTIKIKLNSPGGEVFAGIEIYNYLKDLPQNVIVEVTGLAASAASIIAMGADKVVMRTGSQMMIHEGATYAYGNKNDLQKTINALETIDESIIDIYNQKTGLDRDEIENMLTATTWMTAKEAVDKGFADELEHESGEQSQSSNTSNKSDDNLFNNLNADDLANKIVAKLNKQNEQEVKQGESKINNSSLTSLLL